MTSREQRCAKNAGCPQKAGILLTAGIVIAAVLAHGVPGLANALQWQRGTGIGVTWMTAHLCHWSWNHLAWDVIVFAVLSLLSLRLMPGRYAHCLLVAAIAISAEVEWNQHTLLAYRGLSGIDCALLGLVIAGLWRCVGTPGSRWLAVIACGSFVAKSTCELVTGTTLFVEGQQGFVPVVSAHLTGFCSGLATGFWNARWPLLTMHTASRGIHTISMEP